MAPSKIVHPAHIDQLKSNLAEVDRLLEIHSEIAGKTVGRKYKVEVLNRSALVLLVACWEAFVEDLATNAFEFLLANANDPSVFPTKVRVAATRELRSHPDETKVWELAGDNWKKVLVNHKHTTLKRHVGRLNTPRPAQIDEMFSDLIGLDKLSKKWSWAKNSNADVLDKFEKMVTRRGAIAHRVSEGAAVHKAYVRKSSDAVIRASSVSSNRVRDHLEVQTGLYPWVRIVAGSAR
ncbi:MAG: HEPN domain-containing protein [bacterium]|nr:HEPN domain-containing protein [bacterium]